MLSWAALPEPSFGPDPSWMTALHLAAIQGLDFGSEVIFTFGPLGFLTAPLVIDDTTAVLSFLYELIVRLALAATLVWAARRSFPVLAAAALAFAAMAILLKPAAVVPVDGVDPVVIVAFIWCVVAVAPGAPRFSAPLLIYGGAALSALSLLVKISSGVLLLVLCGLAVLGLAGSRPRNLALFAGAYLATLVVLWLASGQALVGFGDYLNAAREITSGFSSAMATELAEVGWDWLAAALMIVGALAATVLACWGRTARFRLVLLGLIVATFVFFQFKDAFVRHDVQHVTRFPAAMLAPWFAFRWEGRQRLVALGAIACMIAIWFPISGTRPVETFDPLEGTKTAFEDTRTFLLPGERKEAREEARESLAELYGLEADALAALHGQTVHVDPIEVSLAWAYGLDWRPVPVFQTYSAYTPELDEANAALLESDDAPSRIVRYAAYPAMSPVPLDPRLSIDGRYAPYDAPAQSLAMLCNYSTLITTAIYQVLAKTEDRCGEPRPIGSVSARYGETVPVPRPSSPDEVVFARVRGLAPSGHERLRTVLYRALRRYVAFDDAERYRIVPETAADGLILRAAPGVDFPGRFALAPDADEISFERDSGLLASGDELRLDFYSLPVRQPAGA